VVSAAESASFVVVFDERGRDGGSIVGPFADRSQAHAWAAADASPDYDGIVSWTVSPMEAPGA
jgi:hypothetical protein